MMMRISNNIIKYKIKPSIQIILDLNKLVIQINIKTNGLIMILNNNNKIITNKIIMSLNIIATRKNTSLSKKMKKYLGMRASINNIKQN